MGMFTRIVHPVDGREVQIKGGGLWQDRCDEFRVGEEVPYTLNPNVVHSAHLIDGVYDGYSDPDQPEAFVVIKDHRVHAVEDILTEIPRHLQYENVLAQYQVPDIGNRQDILYSTLFTKEAWRVYDREVKRQQAEIDEYVNQKCGPDATPERRFAVAIVAAMGLHKPVNYQDIGRRMIQVDKIPRGR